MGWITDAIGADIEVGNALVIQVDRVGVITRGFGSDCVPGFLSDVELEGEFVQDIAWQTGLVLK